MCRLPFTAHGPARFAQQTGVAELVLMHFAQRYRGRYHKLVDEARAIFGNVSAELE